MTGPYNMPARSWLFTEITRPYGDPKDQWPLLLDNWFLVIHCLLLDDDTD